jgi:hypothetical protein
MDESLIATTDRSALGSTTALIRERKSPRARMTSLIAVSGAICPMRSFVAQLASSIIEDAIAIPPRVRCLSRECICPAMNAIPRCDLCRTESASKVWNRLSVS